jgi:GNAT superfamily N-acetyltransferase
VLVAGQKATAVYVREADLIEDGPALADLAKRYLSSNADEKRFRWLYQENPFGLAQAWIACDSAEKAVGMAAVFPRKMYCNGTVIAGCVLGDFCVSPEYRSLGPALQLQRACLKFAQSESFALAYDFPSTAMVGVYRHLGFHPACTSVRNVKPLRAETYAHSLHVSLPRSVATAINHVLSLQNHRSSRLSGMEFALEDTACTTEYYRLAEKVGSSLGICTIRNAEYLNWRYRQHPHLKYEFLTARRAKELVAYCTFAQSSDEATIAELFGYVSDDDVMKDLLRKLTAVLRARGVAIINLPLLSNDPRNRLLRKLGFWAREAVPAMCFGREADDNCSQMLLMHGDRES